MLLLLLSRFSRVRLCATHRRQPTRLPHPWDSPGKNTGVGCHFLLQCVKVKSLSLVRLLMTPWTAAHQAPLSMRFSRQECWSRVPFILSCSFSNSLCSYWTQSKINLSFIQISLLFKATHTPIINVCSDCKVQP